MQGAELMVRREFDVLISSAICRTTKKSQNLPNCGARKENSKHNIASSTSWIGIGKRIERNREIESRSRRNA
jgi:hypothetical protein